MLSNAQLLIMGISNDNYINYTKEISEEFKISKGLESKANFTKE